MAATTTPTQRRLRSITIAWMMLCAITIGSWWLSPAHSHARAVPSLVITVAVVVLGFVKCRLVIRYFMEVNTAPRWLRMATDTWLLVLWCAVLVIYLY